MLIVKDFLLLNYPKTGTTFTRYLIKSMYDPNIKEFLGVNPMNPDSSRYSPHLSFSQIPADYLDLPVVSIYRDIFDRYISQYTFRWWETNSSTDFKIAAAKFNSDFPKLSFREYLEVLEHVEKPRILNSFNLPSSSEIGLQTIQFIVFYTKNPAACLEDAVSKTNIDLIDYMPKVHFLRQKNLRSDLIDFLSKFNKKESLVDQVNKIPDLNVSRGNIRVEFDEMWPPCLLNEYKIRERILVKYIHDIGLDA